jgi:TolB-like protein/Flp pilus assembly protein TadD/predicted Ser/Thr protein kinase
VTENLPPNTALAHYRIMSKIGEGGMGEVYLAQDTKLDRKVALKILPADLAAHQDRMRRFVQEAKAAAALNHPNIAHIYEIGESDGTHYIAMEFIDGETLRHKIHRDKAPLPKLLKYLIQVAQGLSKAHAAGIVHRDLKPDNIMITRDDYAKILDFGLAKLVEPQRTFGSNESGSSEIATAVMQQPGWDSGHSTPGMVIGTIGYMSPEQASGRVDEIDLRSDIFSFGCMLFEAATGQRAFAGKDVLDSLHKIVHAPTPQLKESNPLAPADLQRVVRRCLAKEREKRYQSIKEVAIELDDLQQELKGFTESQYSGQPAPAPSVSTSGMRPGDEGFRIAVLPFKVRDADHAVEVLAEGLSEEIVTGLSRFRYLSVVTSASAARLEVELENQRVPGAKLGARYVLEGSIRKGGSAIRVSVQLVDTETGAQLWSETYNRDLQTATVFAVQDDVAGRIVATVADSYGVLVHSMRAAIGKKDDVELTPAEWQFQYFAYREQITPSSHAALKSRLQRVSERNDRQSDLWACLAQIYVDEYAFGFEGDATSLDRALAAGRRAVELDRANQFALVALAQVHFFRRDLAAFGPAAERAMALNPLNTDALGILGLEIVHTAEFERGTAIVRHAMELNPNHAGWMHFAPLWDHFHKGEYEQALECANRVDVPGLFWPFLVMASACGHLGRRAEAEAAVRDLLALDPEFAAHVRSNVATWHFASGLMDPILEGLRKAGLEIVDEESPSISSSARMVSSESRADEGFWIAVLPFKITGTQELTALAEGLSEEISTGLSRFSYLRVIARSSTLKYASETSDVRTLGQELKARYVMEGSLRQVGLMLRVSVQLVDASTGAQLWAETYDRQFRAEEIFALQDDLVPIIVSTAADINGVLPRSMCDAVCSRSPETLSPYEAVLRSFRYFDRVTADELTFARTCIELAVEKAPSYADAWAMLALLCCQDYGQGFNLQSDSLTRGINAAQRAVEAGPSNHLAYFSLAQARFFQKDFQSFRNAAERAVALNPMDGNSLAFMGELLTYSGDSDRGLALASRAKQINPYHPGWFWYADFFHAYRQGDYGDALDLILKTNLPGHWGMHAGIAASAGQLGQGETASKAVRELLKLRPDFCTTVHDTMAKWFDPELRAHLIDGLRKAGLEIADEEPSSTIKTIAVLPFQNLSGDPEQEYFADGITEEILNALAQIRGLRVAGRSSAFSFKGRNEDLRSVGAKLNVGTILEGTLRRAGDRLRITAQLIDVANGYQIWSERYDRVIADVFTVQDEIATTIAGRLQLSLSTSGEVEPAEPPTRHIGAYELYLKGRGLLYQRGLSIPKAIDCFKQAVSLDPTYAQAWAGLADGYTTSGYSGFTPAIEVMPLALDAARQALELDENVAEAHNALACATLLYERDYALAEREFRRALELNPNYPQARAWYGLFYVDWVAGRPTEARDELLRLLQIDPLSGYAHVIFSLSCSSNDLISEAVEHGRRGVELDPSSYLAQWTLSLALECNAQYQEASIVAERALAMSGRHCWALTTLASIYAAWGKRDDARAVYNELEARRTREYIQPSMLAISASAVGEMAQALAYAQQALDEKDPLFVMIARSWGQYKKLRNDFRFLKIVSELGFPNWNPEVAR